MRFRSGRRVEVLPCTYGYGQTIRKCQGLTLVHGCLFFDSPTFPAARGYGPSVTASCYSHTLFTFPSVVLGFCCSSQVARKCFHWLCGRQSLPDQRGRVPVFQVAHLRLPPCRLGAEASREDRTRLSHQIFVFFFRLLSFSCSLFAQSAAV